MKTIGSILLMMALCWNISFAQDSDEHKAKIQEARKTFFTEELQLSADEAQKFWPLYNQYRTDKKALEKQFKKDKKIQLMTDKEVEDYILQNFKLEEEVIALKKQYFEKLRTHLPIRKIAMLPRTEKKFKRELFDRFKKRRRNGGNGRKRSF